jgi:hypothetical protein
MWLWVIWKLNVKQHLPLPLLLPHLAMPLEMALLMVMVVTTLILIRLIPLMVERRRRLKRVMGMAHLHPATQPFQRRQHQRWPATAATPTPIQLLPAAAPATAIKMCGSRQRVVLQHRALHSRKPAAAMHSLLTQRQLQRSLLPPLVVQAAATLEATAALRLVLQLLLCSSLSTTLHPVLVAVTALGTAVMQSGQQTLSRGSV